MERCSNCQQVMYTAAGAAPVILLLRTVHP